MNQSFSARLLTLTTDDRIAAATILSGAFVEQERRRTPRYPFIATAEVLKPGATGGVSARVTELSLHGCFIEMPNPLAKGAELLAKIYSEGKFFEALGTVAYSTPNGFGVSFHDVRPQFLGVLKQWLLAAAIAKYGRKE